MGDYPRSDARHATSSEDEARLIKELRSLKSQRTRRQARVAKATRMAADTYSPRVRNAAALALADLQAASAKDVLIDLLRRPDTNASRGTLLYALDQLRAEMPVLILAEIVAEDSYEAREEALSFIASGRVEGSDEEFAHARSKLEAAMAWADPERSQAIRRALGYLTTAI